MGGQGAPGEGAGGGWAPVGAPVGAPGVALAPGEPGRGSPALQVPPGAAGASLCSPRTPQPCSRPASPEPEPLPEVDAKKPPSPVAQDDISSVRVLINVAQVRSWGARGQAPLGSSGPFVRLSVARPWGVQRVVILQSVTWPR